MKKDWLTPELIDEFKDLFKKKYGVNYTNEEAKEAAENLVKYFELLVEIDRKKKGKRQNLIR